MRPERVVEAAGGGQKHWRVTSQQAPGKDDQLGSRLSCVCVRVVVNLGPLRLTGALPLRTPAVASLPKDHLDERN